MKSHVSMEQKQCAICSKTYDTNAILLDKRLKPTLEQYTVTGLGICPECKKEGFVALIVCDKSKSTATNPYRTGEVIYIKKEVALDWLKITMKVEFAFIYEDLAEVIRNAYNDVNNKG